jgi:hypothetical protein
VSHQAVDHVVECQWFMNYTWHHPSVAYKLFGVTTTESVTKDTFGTFLCSTKYTFVVLITGSLQEACMLDSCWAFSTAVV